MKAAVFEGEGIFTLKEVEKPRILKADDIIGKIEVCSVCGLSLIHISSDLRLRK